MNESLEWTLQIHDILKQSLCEDLSSRPYKSHKPTLQDRKNYFVGVTTQVSGEEAEPSRLSRGIIIEEHAKPPAIASIHC